MKSGRRVNFYSNSPPSSETDRKKRENEIRNNRARKCDERDTLERVDGDVGMCWNGGMAVLMNKCVRMRLDSTMRANEMSQATFVRSSGGFGNIRITSIVIFLLLPHQTASFKAEFR